MIPLDILVPVSSPRKRPRRDPPVDNKNEDEERRRRLVSLVRPLTRYRLLSFLFSFIKKKPDGRRIRETVQRGARRFLFAVPRLRLRRCLDGGRHHQERHSQTARKKQGHSWTERRFISVVAFEKPAATTASATAAATATAALEHSQFHLPRLGMGEALAGRFAQRQL